MTVLASVLLCVWLPLGALAYDPFQTDTSEPWAKNSSTRFHPVRVENLLGSALSTMLHLPLLCSVMCGLRG